MDPRPKPSNRDYLLRRRSVSTIKKTTTSLDFEDEHIEMLSDLRGYEEFANVTGTLFMRPTSRRQQTGNATNL